MPAATVASKKNKELVPHVENAMKSIASLATFQSKFKVMLLEGHALTAEDQVPKEFLQEYHDVVQEASVHHDAGKISLGKLKALMS